MTFNCSSGLGAFRQGRFFARGARPAKPVKRRSLDDPWRLAYSLRLRDRAEGGQQIAFVVRSLVPEGAQPCRSFSLS